MLILSRKTNEAVVIECNGEMIRVVVIETRNDKCRLGFKAANHVRINRQEVHDRQNEGDEHARD